MLTLRLFSSTLRLFSSTVCPCSRALPRACAHGFAGLKRWIELGNSGVFRPEMLRPMGLPENVTVIAWGISLERPTMIKYKYNNIRDLCGHKVNLQMVQDNPMCRLDKN